MNTPGPLTTARQDAPPSPLPGRRPDYGLDAPGLVHWLLLGGGGLVLLGVALQIAHAGLAGGILLRAGLYLAAGGVLMVLSSRFGKLRARDRLLDGLRLRGDETLLDVGCGHGLLLIGAARRLERGLAVGIDLWSQRDQAGNRSVITLANARLEGVAGRVVLCDGDMRRLPFRDGGFDVVVSSLAVHNLESEAAREMALRELVRVLSPSGRLALLDIRHSGRYAEVLREAGLTDVRVSPLSFWILPPCRTVAGRKAIEI